MKRTRLTSIAFFFVSFPILFLPSCAQAKPTYYHAGDVWEFTMNESQSFQMHYEECIEYGFVLELERQSDEDIPYLYLLDLGASFVTCNGETLEIQMRSYVIFVICYRVVENGPKTIRLDCSLYEKREDDNYGLRVVADNWFALPHLPGGLKEGISIEFEE